MGADKLMNGGGELRDLILVISISLEKVGILEVG